MQNDILPFCPEGTEVAGDLVPLETYTQSEVRVSGMRSGIASRAMFNRVLRQTSFVSAALAEFVSTYAVRDVLDNGDVSGLARDIVTAVQTCSKGTYAGSGVVTVTDNVISVDMDALFADIATALPWPTTYTAGDGIHISFDNVISATGAGGGSGGGSSSRASRYFFAQI